MNEHRPSNAISCNTTSRMQRPHSSTKPYNKPWLKDLFGASNRCISSWFLRAIANRLPLHFQKPRLLVAETIFGVDASPVLQGSRLGVPAITRRLALRQDVIFRDSMHLYLLAFAISSIVMMHTFLSPESIVSPIDIIKIFLKQQ